MQDKRTLGAVLVSLALLATACSGSTTITDSSAQATEQTEDSTTADGSAGQIEPTALPQPTAVPLPTSPPEPTLVPEPTATSAPQVTVELWADGKQLGDCFNSADGTADPRPGASVDCQAEHEYEIYFIGAVADGPSAPFPTSSDFTDLLFTDFCDPALIEFAGEPWDELPVGTSVWSPSEEEWLAGDRSFACTAEAGLRDENIFKVGTAAGGTLDRDEGMVSRATVDGQRDFYFTVEGSTLYPFTSGQYELPNTSPSVIGTGFLFASPLQDVDLPSLAYDYEFETGDINRLETGLEGWELASPHFLQSIPAFLFAARENDTDDWDIFVSENEDDVVNLTDRPGDDLWPTITPDGSQVVYSAGGNIWIMNVDGSDNRQLTDAAGGDFETSVSPDGSQIVFASDRSGNDDIWIMSIDGSDQRNLSDHPAAEAWPFFSLDGTTIYFQTDRLGVRANIMMMELDGSNQSYYSREFMTNAAVLSPEVSERLEAQLETIAQAQANRVEGVAPGAPDQPTEILHSSERLRVPVPGSWEWEEVETDEIAEFVAAPSIAAYETTWAADGASAMLVAADSNDALVDRLGDATAAVDESCVETDQSVVTVSETRTSTIIRYECGTGNAAIVAGVFDPDIATGLIFQGQWDGDPSQAEDEALVVGLAESIAWG